MIFTAKNGKKDRNFRITPKKLIISYAGLRGCRMRVARHPVSFGELVVLPIAAIHHQFTVKNGEKFGMSYQDEYYVSKSLGDTKFTLTMFIII